MDIEHLEAYTALHCGPNYDYGYFGRFLVLCQFFPLYLRIVLLALTFTPWNQELYYWLVSTGVTINGILNWVLQSLLPNEPDARQCGNGYGMPSWHAQLTFFFYTVVLTYLLFWRTRTSVFNLVALNTTPALVCAARLALGYDTFEELMVGNLVGVLLGFTFQGFVMTYVRPRVRYIIGSPVVRWLGIQDNLILASEEPNTVTRSLSSDCVLCLVDPGHTTFHC